MPVTEFTIGTSRTINLGNFESLRIEASIHWNVEDVDWDVENRDARLKQQIAAAQAELRRLLEDTYRAQTKKNEKKIA